MSGGFQIGEGGAGDNSGGFQVGESGGFQVGGAPAPVANNNDQFGFAAASQGAG